MSTLSILWTMGHRWISAACGLLPAARRWVASGWGYLRAVSGDDAYERYLAHHAAAHSGETPMTRKAYFAERQRQKWSGVTRCC